MHRRVAYACLAALLALPAAAAPLKFTLAPNSVQVRFRAFGLGLLAINGHFTRFDGTLVLDPDNPAACTLVLHADTASLRMPEQSMTDEAQGPDLLDVTNFPDFRVEGQCQGSTLQGTLSLHGVSRPVQLETSIGNGAWTASGYIRRADWGMGGRPLLAGPHVQISLTAGLPPGFLAGAPPNGRFPPTR